MVELSMAMAGTEPINELQTIRDFVRWGASQFNRNKLWFGHGTDNAVDEALLLLGAELHLPLPIPLELYSARLCRDEKQQIVNLFRRRIDERLPAAYLIRQAWFAGLEFYVDQRVLVPRSPMAEIIAKGFEPWTDSTQIESVLDLCTGSGCIAIAAAYAFPKARVDAVDISEDALAVARINVNKHGVGGHVSLIQSNLFDGLTGRRYDVIISNPPYVTAADMASLPEEYRHEPALGLAAGEDGLSIVSRILVEAPKFLKPNGILIVEVGNTMEELVERYSRVPFTWVEFDRGEDGVFVLSRQELEEHGAEFRTA